VPADIVLVGLDCADRTLVARLADAGQLPVIAGVRAPGRAIAGVVRAASVQAAVGSTLKADQSSA
jgi:Asp/Glu/hydantoin racemase